MADRCSGSIGAGPHALDPAPLAAPSGQTDPRARSHDRLPRTSSLPPGAALLAAALLAGCDRTPTTSAPPSPPSAIVVPPLAALPAPMPAEILAPKGAVLASNPLGLPPHPIKLDPGRRVFAFPERMLATAKLGSTLVLYAASVVGFEGDDLLVDGREGPSYKVHPGYVIPVPDAPRVRPRDAVLTEWNGAMKHAVVTRLVKDRIEVRYTDMDPRTPLGLLKNVHFVRQVEGLAPGNYAAWKDGDTWRHVLLVSRLGDAAAKPGAVGSAPPGGARWFALGYGGAALLVDEQALRPIPIQPQLKVGASVWAEWVGALRPAVVQSADETGAFTVKFERAGRPVTVGWGSLLPPIDL